MPMKKRRYGPGVAREVAKVVREFKRGTLRSGKGRHPIAASRKQAIAIGLSEARNAGANVPSRARRPRR